METSAPAAFPDVRSVLPHRDPFLFLDRIVEMTDTRVVGTRCFRADEGFFTGHFPGNPVVPGVILVEGLAQTMAYHALSRLGAKRVFLVGIDRARFRSIVTPGQEVTFEIQLGEERLGMLSAKGRVRAGHVRVADASLIGYSGEAAGSPP